MSDPGPISSSATTRRFLRAIPFVVASSFVLLPALASAQDMDMGQMTRDMSLTDIAGADLVSDTERDLPPVDGELSIETIAPTTALARSEVRVRIEGTGFGRTTAGVRLGLVPLRDVVVESATVINGTTDKLPAGVYDVTVDTADGRSATLSGAFELVDDASVPAPIIATVDPPVVSAGQRFSITGAAFVDGLRVEVGGTAVAQVQMLNGASLDVTLPPDFVLGRHDVRVVNPDGQFALAAQNLEVTQVDPASGDCACRAVTTDTAPWPTSSAAWIAAVLVGLLTLRRRRRS